MSEPQGPKWPFTRPDRDEVVFFHPADHNWWKASLEGSRLSWALSGNTSGFGSGYAANIGSAVLRGAFSGGLSELLFFSAFDRHAWLGAFRGNTLGWGLVDAPSPIAPTSLSLTTVAESSVSLRWANTNRAGNVVVSIKVERKTGINGGWGQIASLSSGASTFVDYGVTVGTAYYYRVVASNPFERSRESNEVQATPAYEPPAISDFRADPATIDLGGSSTLRFSTQRTTEVRIEPNIGPVSLSRTRNVSPVTTTAYTLIAKGRGGEVRRTVTVRVMKAGASRIRFSSWSANQSSVLLEPRSNDQTLRSDAEVTMVYLEGIAFTNMSIRELTLAPPSAWPQVLLASYADGTTIRRGLSNPITNWNGKAHGQWFCTVLPDRIWGAATLELTVVVLWRYQI